MEIGTMIVNIDVVMKNVFFPIASMFKKYGCVEFHVNNGGSLLQECPFISFNMDHSQHLRQDLPGVPCFNFGASLLQEYPLSSF